MEKDFNPPDRKVFHLHPYHYSLIHHNLGVPLSSMQPPLYHLDIDNEASKNTTGMGEAGITGTKVNQNVRG